MSKLALKIPQTEAEHRSLGEQLTSQYERACAGMTEYVAFGALANNVKEAINGARAVDTRPGGKNSKGTGFKGWLGDYAPSISERTAARYIDLAEGVKAEFALGERVDLHRLLKGDDLDKAEKARREKISSFIEGKSQRQLLISIGKYEPPAKSTKVTKLTEEEKQAEFIEAARSQAVTTMSSFHTLQDRWKLLKDSQLRLSIEDAERFVKQAKKWLDTPLPNRGLIDAAAHLNGELREDLDKLNEQFDAASAEEAKG
jgi:hypothetical protein